MRRYPPPVRILGAILAFSVCTRAQQALDIQQPNGQFGLPGKSLPCRNRARCAAAEFRPLRFADTGGQSLPVGPRCGGPGDREQHRRGDSAVRSAAGPASAAPRAGRRRAAKRRSGRGRRPAERELAGSHGQRVRHGDQRGQRRHFRRRHRHAIGARDSFARSDHPGLHQLRAHHLGAEQHLAHGNHRPGFQHQDLSKASLHRPSISASPPN